MITVTLDNLVPSGEPADGWIVKYRIKGTTGAYTTPVGSPYSTFPIVFTTTDPDGTLYEGTIQCDCGDVQSTLYNWVTPCACNATYAPSADGSQCEKHESEDPTITHSDYCLVASVNGAYSNYKMRIYTAGYVLADLDTLTDTPNAFGSSNLAPYWANPTALTTAGVFNRESVWIDSDCDGTIDPLAPGVKVTIAAQYTNSGAPKVVYIGVSGDNFFEVKVNGSSLINFNTVSDKSFKIWHVLPVNIPTGTTYFNVIGTGDGTVSDAIAMVVYNNTAAEILAATSDADLNIIFKSSSLRGNHYDVATCDAGWTLDTSGGAGSYVCRRTLVEDCNKA